MYKELSEIMRCEFLERTSEKNEENTIDIKEYRFMTNFGKEDRYIYEKAITATGVDMFIKDDAYCGIDHDQFLKDTNALWVNVRIGDCGKFWRVHRAIKEFYKEKEGK